jgi:hypothetical protein
MGNYCPDVLMDGCVLQERAAGSQAWMAIQSNPISFMRRIKRSAPGFWLGDFANRNYWFGFSIKSFKSRSMDRVADSPLYCGGCFSAVMNLAGLFKPGLNSIGPLRGQPRNPDLAAGEVIAMDLNGKEGFLGSYYGTLTG